MFPTKKPANEAGFFYLQNLNHDDFLELATITIPTIAKTPPA